MTPEARARQSIDQRLTQSGWLVHEQQVVVEMLEHQLENVALQSGAITSALLQSEAQRKNILKAAFSGQLVPQDPNDEPASVLMERIRASRAQGASAPTRRPRKAREPA